MTFFQLSVGTLNFDFYLLLFFVVFFQRHWFRVTFVHFETFYFLWIFAFHNCSFRLNFTLSYFFHFTLLRLFSCTISRFVVFFLGSPPYRMYVCVWVGCCAVCCFIHEIIRGWSLWRKNLFFFFQLFLFSVCGRTFFSVSLFFLLAALFVVVCINIQIIQL